MSTKEYTLEMSNALTAIAEEPEGDYHIIATNLTDLFENKFMLTQIIQEGIPYSLFSKIEAWAPFTQSDWASILGLSTKSLQRYKGDKTPFKPIHSEKILELTEVTQLGYSVFSSMKKFYSWLEHPSFALGNKEPFELLRDSYGKYLVMRELHQIDHGIFA